MAVHRKIVIPGIKLMHDADRKSSSGDGVKPGDWEGDFAFQSDDRCSLLFNILTYKGLCL